jgi:hypothetical protein
MKRTLSVALLAIVIGAPATAQPKRGHDDQKASKKHAQDANHAVNREYPVAAIDYFPPQDVQILREHYEPRYRSLPPGLAKKYARTGSLPPGWQKKIEPLPVAVERRLVVLPPAYRRGYIDGTVVVYSPRTEVVVDIVALLGQ